MAGPVINIVYKPREKGSKSTKVMSIWRNENEHGVFYSAQPKVEADKFGTMTMVDAIEQVAQKEGFLNVYINEPVEPPEDF